MKKLLLSIAVVVGLWFGGRELLSVLASDETKIARLVEGMERGFNRGRLNPCIEPLAPTWRHAGSDVTRALLADHLRAHFLTERHPQTKELLYRAEVDWDAFAVEVDDAGATIRFDIRFFLDDGSPDRRLEWHARVDGDLEQREDGWVLVRTRHEDVEGERF